MAEPKNFSRGGPKNAGVFGISIASALPVRVIFAAWLLLALLLLGLGRLNTTDTREPAPKRLSALR